MMGNVRIVFDGARMEEIMHGTTGPIARHMIKRAEIVKRAAVVQCNKRTNKLSKSIVKRAVEDDAYGLSIRIGAYQPYALWVHDGTKPHVILPKKPGGVLHWVDASGNKIFARKVNHPGYKGNKFLSDNLKLFFE